jgi:hypothetical protein
MKLAFVARSRLYMSAIACQYRPSAYGQSYGQEEGGQNGQQAFGGQSEQRQGARLLR